MQNQHDLQQRLKALIHGVREHWSYGIFWQSSLDYSGAPYLGWGDGYFRGDVDYATKAKSKGLGESSSAEQEHRKSVLRELNSLIAGTESTKDDIDEEVTDTEWFFLVSMTQSFANGNGLPGQAFFNRRPVWVAGSDRLGSSSCERARQSKVFGLQTMVCIPLGNGVIELGSTELIYHSSDLMNKARVLFHFSIFEVGSSPFRTIYSDQGVNDQNDQSSFRISAVENKGKEFLAPATSFYSENRWKYDVFLSFRGADTRNTFTGHLYQALCDRGIITFIDDKLERGEEISPALLRVIEESRISIVIFSENYANSSYCLDELVKILECRESKRQVVFPVFYNVDPSDVEEQKGSFVLHFHAGWISLVKLLQWKTALMKAAGLSGWHLVNGHESRYIQSIVDRVLSILNRTFLHVADYPVGLDSHINDITCKLSIESNDVRMIGIWGIGGIGKTTVAKAIYNRIAIQFEGSCFLANVREISKQYSVVQLQENLLSQILGHRTFLMGNFDMGINVISARLRSKRVLVVIDDVDSVDQLKKLAGEIDWFGAGSRIIITSRDKHLLVSHGVKCVHKMEELGPTDALLLFSWNAFRKPQPAEEFLELSHEVVNYAKGLPLALSVLGSFLYHRSVHEWECELDKLKRIPNRQIYEILKISYDGLEENEKSIFLDIARFFRGMDEDYVINILHACNLNPVIGIKVLTEKSLISIENKKLQMHDLLQAMGRRIVHEESSHLPSRRSRLWFREDVLNVLTENMGTDQIEGIMLDLHEPEEVQLSANVFEKMTRLRILIIRNAQLTTGPINLPNELKWVEWPGYPFSLVPPTFRARKLVGLEMICSSIRQFEGFKNYSYLKFLDFKGSKFLTETPDFSTIPNLERLSLESCINLVEVHESVGCLRKLKFLSLQFCSNLRSLPSKFKLISLDTFLLTACEKLEAFPDIVEMMPRLGKLCLSGTALKVLPSSIKNITHLKVLTLTYCKELTDLPCSIYQLRHLEHLLLEGCSKLGKYPVNVQNKAPSTSSLGFLKLEWLDLQKCSLVDIDFLMMHEFFPTLKELDLSGNNLVVLPAIFSVLTNLKCLKLSECKKLQEIPDLPLNIRRLEARDCDLLERYSQLVRKGERPAGLCIVDFSNCHKLAENRGKILENASLSQGFEKYLPIDICLPGSEVPDWFAYRTETGSLTFRVPSHMSQEIKALVFCVILCFEDGITATLSCETLIDGESAFSCSRQFLLLQSDHTWFYCHPYPNDKVFAPERNHAVNFEISFEVLGAPAGEALGRCGVHLVYKQDKTVNDPSASRCTSHHIESVSLDPMRSCYSNDLELNLNPISNRKRMADDETGKQLSLFSQARNKNLSESMMGFKTGELQQEQSLSSSAQPIERRFNLQRKVRRQSSTLTKENKK